MMEFSRATVRKARKARPCCLCCTQIEAGELYERWAVFNEGTTHSIEAHIVCNKWVHFKGFQEWFEPPVLMEIDACLERISDDMVLNKSAEYLANVVAMMQVGFFDGLTTPELVQLSDPHVDWQADTRRFTEILVELATRYKTQLEGLVRLTRKESARES